MQHSNRLESEVRGYVRSFPTTFVSAAGAIIKDENHQQYIDFLAGAGALNYGHNNPLLKMMLLDYIEKNGVTHGLDLATKAKETFINTFDKFILKPRDLDYKMQFTGPTGTNAVEAAIKLAQIVKGRTNIITFSNAYHGHSKGSLRLTANEAYREGIESDLQHSTTFMPFCNYVDGDFSSADYLQKVLEDKGSGIDKPAAVILETIQGEGGVNVASKEWLQKIRQITQDNDVLLIIDDIQVGCGRTGSFFSFEEAGIKPDMVTLSKSLSAYGLPMSLLLFSPELDKWSPGQHTGTFRGNNLAFVTATEAIRIYWRDKDFQEEIGKRSAMAFSMLNKLKDKYPDEIKQIKGKGLIIAIQFESDELASAVGKECFDNNLIIETCGPDGDNLKLLPPLNIETEYLEKGIEIIEQAVESVLVEK